MPITTANSDKKDFKALTDCVFYMEKRECFPKTGEVSEKYFSDRLKGMRKSVSYHFCFIRVPFLLRFIFTLQIRFSRRLLAVLTILNVLIISVLFVTASQQVKLKLCVKGGFRNSVQMSSALEDILKSSSNGQVCI